MIVARRKNDPRALERPPGKPPVEHFVGCREDRKRVLQILRHGRHGCRERLKISREPRLNLDAAFRGLYLPIARFCLDKRPGIEAGIEQNDACARHVRQTPGIKAAEA